MSVTGILAYQVAVIPGSSRARRQLFLNAKRQPFSSLASQPRMRLSQ
jgi:hypothetical protein